jgi:endonuclease/exonuclease/phosphatase (EEP) superfamily protein YafD
MAPVIQSSTRFRIGLGSTVLSTVLFALITICFIGLWDLVAAITIFPQWCWALLGIFLSYFGWRLCKRRWLLLMPAVWVITAILFSDNVTSVLRMARPSPTAPSTTHHVRVVTLNCAGRAAAAEEIVALKPDVVLLQEIPSTNDLARCTQACFSAGGAFVSGLDCAILAGGAIEIRNQNEFPPQFIRAQVQLKGGKNVLVTSLRLIPPEGRLDLWNSTAWRASTENRRLRRTQLLAALERSMTETGLPEILGGDFNAPVSDSVFRLLPAFQDAHQEAGIGWGNTAINNFPIARPDQIRVKGFRVISCRAVQTRNSDHRLVVADLEEVD